MASNEAVTPYYRAARFQDEQSAGAAYFQIEELLFKEPDNDLSVYRLILNGVWHVVIIGDAPGDDLGQQIEMALSIGESVSLAEDVLNFLRQRRVKGSKLAPWVERHFRPGRHFQI